MPHKKPNPNITLEDEQDFLTRKRKAVEFEKTNYHVVGFMRALDGYWIAGGHSAVILKYLISPDVKRQTALKKDQEYKVFFKEGICAIRNKDAWIRAMSESKYLGEIVENKDGTGFYFPLKEEMPHEQYELLAKTEEIHREQLLNLISSSALLPKTRQSLRELVKISYAGASTRSNSAERELMTYRVIDFAHDAFDAFLIACKDKELFDEMLDKTVDYIKAIQRELYILDAANIWSVSESRNLSFVCTRTLTKLADERARYDRIKG